MPRAIDAAHPSEIQEITWTIWPDDILEALDFLLVYLRYNKSVVRNPVVDVTKTNERLKQAVKVDMRRAIPSKALNCAARLVNPGIACPASKGGAYHWYLKPNNKVKERLAGAGIDIKTLEVVDKRRWGFALLQLYEKMDTRFGVSYSGSKQEDLVRSLAADPEIRPHVRTSKCLTPFARKMRREERMKRQAAEEQLKESESPRISKVVDQDDDLVFAPGTVGHTLMTDRFGRRIDY